MVRHAFFSFHYQNDVWRSNVVRNADSLDGVETSYIDGADREEVKTDDPEQIREWIDNQLSHTSVTAIIIGEETAEREYIRYEIKRSIERGNGLVGIRVHDIENKNGEVGEPGPNPLEEFMVKRDSEWVPVSDIFETYNFSAQDGYNHLGDWLETGATRAETLSEEEQKSVAHSSDVPVAPDTETLRNQKSSQQTNLSNILGSLLTVGTVAIGIVIARIIKDIQNGYSLDQAIQNAKEDILDIAAKCLSQQSQDVQLPEGPDNHDPWKR